MYISPSDTILSPASQKISALKGKRFGGSGYVCFLHSRSLLSSFALPSAFPSPPLASSPPPILLRQVDLLTRL